MSTMSTLEVFQLHQFRYYLFCVRFFFPAQTWLRAPIICTYEDRCLLLYLDMSTYIRVLVLLVLNRRTVRLLRCVCFCSNSICFARVPFSFFFRSVAVASGVSTSMRLTQQHLRGLLLLLYLWAPTSAAAAVPMTCSIVILGCCCCCLSSID